MRNVVLSDSGSVSKIFLSTLVFWGIVTGLQAINNDSGKITLEKIWKERVFEPKTIRLGKSMADGERYTLVERSYLINVYQYNSGLFLETLLDFEGMVKDEQGESYGIEDYQFSNDEKRILIGANRESIYRHSSRSDYYIYNFEDNRLTSLSENGKQSIPQFSPDGNKVAFVRNNNIYIKNLISGEEFRITHDGKWNHIINGITDWVYEEEFGFTVGFHWSPDGKRIAYYRFDESHVKEFVMMMYGELYPEKYRFKYPKAGEDNSKVTIHIYNVEGKTTLTVDTGNEKDQYIPRIKWTNDPAKLAVLRLNRHQNHLEILLADALTGNSSVIYEEKNKYFVKIDDDLTFLKDGKSFIISSDMDGYRHLYLYDLSGEKIRQLTKGNWDVNRLLGLDEKRGIVYFTSYEEGPLENHLYKVNLNGRNKKKLTSELGFHSPSFSRTFKYFINNHTTINTPSVFTVHDSEGKTIKVLENNEQLLKVTKDYNYTQVEFFTFITDDQAELNGWMIKPADFNPDEKYPVFMYVYGGPGSQTVSHRWNTFNGAWFQMLSQMGYIVVSIDNRGTGGRGVEFEKMTYLQLGKYEAIDQINAAKYLGRLDYVDENRIGIFGWSYGGYLSSLCLALGSDVFSMAIAVAPVTSWRFYDTIYTERYMRTPQENPDGYDDNSPLNHVSKIKGDYLLIHGSADDNVHYQNAMEMAKSLIDHNIDFEMMIYPDHDHSIRGGYARLHLYKLMTDFILRKL
jgi:dipeptidyl-peptidase 4